MIVLLFQFQIVFYIHSNFIMNKKDCQIPQKLKNTLTKSSKTTEIIAKTLTLSSDTANDL